MTILEQTELIAKTEKFIDRYGVSQKWLASKTNIPEKKFSEFINMKLALSKNQCERLVTFLVEWDRRMDGFDALEN